MRKVRKTQTKKKSDSSSGDLISNLFSLFTSPRETSGKTPEQLLTETRELSEQLLAMSTKTDVQESDEKQATDLLSSLFRAAGDMYQTALSGGDAPSRKEAKNLIEKGLKQGNSHQAIKQTVKQEINLQQKTASIYHEVTLKLLAFADNPIATAICSNQLFIENLITDKDLRVDYSRHIELIAFLKKQPTNEIARKIDLLCSPFHGTPLSAFDNYDINQLDEKYQEFKKSKLDIRKTLKTLLPELKSRVIEKIAVDIEQARNQIIIRFPQYVEHETALRDFLVSQGLSQEDIAEQKDTIRRDFSKHLLEAAKNQDNVELKVAIETRAMSYTEFYDQFYKDKNRLTPLSYEDIRKKRKAFKLWVANKSQTLMCQHKLAEMKKLEKKSSDIWDLPTFKDKVQDLKKQGKKFGIFFTCCEASKKDERLPHLRYLLKQFKTDEVTALVNRTSNAQNVLTLSPFQCAVKSNASKIANWMLTHCDLSLDNLKVALELTEPTSALKNSIQSQISKKEQSSKPTLLTPESSSPEKKSEEKSEEKVSVQLILDKKAELDKFNQQNKEWISHLHSRFNLEEKFLSVVKEPFSKLKTTFTQLNEEWKQIESKINEIEKKFSKEKLELLDEDIQKLIDESVKLSAKFAQIPVKLERIKKKVEQLALPDPIIKPKKIKKLKKPVEKLKPKVKSEKLEIKKAEAPSIVEIRSPIPIPEKPSLKISLSDNRQSLWQSRREVHKQTRQAILKSYCEFKPEQTVDKIVQYNAILFQVMRYIEIERTLNLPVGYAEKISEQLGVLTLNRLRNGLVHSYNLLSLKIGDELDQELKEVIGFAKQLTSAMQKQEFTSLKEYPFYQRIIIRGQELEQKFDRIESDSKAIDYILCLSAQQLRLAALKSSDFPSDMHQDASKMVNIRLNKYFPPSAEERRKTNQKVHLPPLEGDSEQKLQAVVYQLENDWMPSSLRLS